MITPAAGSRHLLRAGAALALAAGLALATAIPAQAVQTYVTLGPKTCTGSNFLASTSNATIGVQHKVVTTTGAFAIRQFTNYTGTYKVTNYYTGMHGKVIYDGHSFVQIYPTWESGTIGTAKLFCDY